MLRETIFASTSLKSLYLLSSLFFTFCTSKFFLGTAAFVLLSLCFCFLQTQTCVKRYYPSGPSIVSLITLGPVHDFVRDPREFTNSLQTLTATYGEVLSLWIGLTRAVVTEVPADIVHISSDPVTFPRASKLKDAFGLITPGGLFCMDKSQHCITRRKLRDKFNHKMLYSFQNAMSVATGELKTNLHICMRQRLRGNP